MELKEVEPEQCVDLTARAAARPRGVYLPPNPRDESPHGVYGMSHAGTPEKGRAVVEAAAAALAAFIREFHG